MRFRATAAQIFAVLLLQGWALTVQARPASGIDGQIQAVRAKDAALRKDVKKLRLRENIMAVVSEWESVRKKAKGKALADALQGEAEAWKLLAHWSGREDDKKRAREAISRAERGEPERTAKVSKKTAPAEEKVAKPNKVWLTGIETIRHDDRIEFVLRAEGTFESRRGIIPASRGRPVRVFFDFTPMIVAGSVARDVETGSAQLRQARIGQFDPDTARFVVDLADSRDAADRVDVVENRVIVRLVHKEPPPLAAHDAAVSPREGVAEENASDSPASSVEVDQPESRSADATEAELDRAADKLKALLAKVVPDAKEPSPAEDPPSHRETTKSEPEEALLAGIVAELKSSPEAASEESARESFGKCSEPSAAAPREQVPTPNAPPGSLKKSTREAALARRTSLLAIKKVVIDAGHGGKDVGAIGPGGIREKDVNLAIARRLGQELRSRLGVEVVYTRTTDKFLALRARSQLANRANGDLFISIHANANRRKSIHGIETYFLNTTTNRYSQRLAQRENAQGEFQQIHLEPTVGSPGEDDGALSLPDGAVGRDLRLILADLAMRSATIESRRLAGYVQTSLIAKLKRKHSDVRDLGVKHALFYVLLGARMPSVLIETGFVSNPTEAKRLASASYQIEVARAIARGIERFARERDAIARHQVEDVEAQQFAGLGRTRSAP